MHQDKMQSFYTDRKAVGPVLPRPAAELVSAQRRLAELALSKENPQAWLSDVLRALGLHRVISQA